MTGVALLAPGATRGDARIGQTNLRAGNVPSLGGLGAEPLRALFQISAKAWSKQDRKQYLLRA